MASLPTAICKTARDAASDLLDENLEELRRRTVEAHLGNCQSCEEFVKDLRLTVRLLAQLNETSSSASAEEKAKRSYSEYYPEPETPKSLEDWTPIKLAWGRLARLSRQDRHLLITNTEDYLDPLLCDWLLVRARRVSSADPDCGLPLADAALQIARRRQERFRDKERLVAALDAMAWCLLMLRRFAPAAEILNELEALCKTSVVSVEGQARYFATKGVYLSDLGDFVQGERLLKQALDLWCEIGSRRDIVCQLVNLAGTVLSSGEGHRALGLYREAEELLDVAKDPPRLQLAVYSNLMLALCEEKQTDRARKVLGVVRQLSVSVGGWYSGIYTSWLEGTLLRVEGRYAEAEQVFEGVRREFLARSHVVWYVEASLDLAHVYMQQAEMAKLNALAADLTLRVEDSGCDERVRGAVFSFRQAVQHCSLSRQVLRSIAVALRAARVGQHG